MAVFRPDLYDAALGHIGGDKGAPGEPFGAFAGPAFDSQDLAGYLACFAVTRHTR
jgi:NitT/TauT family transport system ATP-binding protein